MKILITGASGLLGKELMRYFPNAYTPSHKVFDITKPKTIKGKYGLIIHLAGYTNVAKAETDKKNCSKVNIEGTWNLVKRYPDIPFVYISSEYAINPINYYSKTKAMAEFLVELFCDNYLIIRTLFKPRPYPFDVAFADQYTRGDYSDVIAKLIAKEIKAWNRKSKTIHVGTKRKTMLELARQTNPNVKPNSVKDIKGVNIPTDYGQKIT